MLQPTFSQVFPVPNLLHDPYSYSCSESGWKGVVGEVPSLEQVQEALTERDLYM